MLKNEYTNTFVDVAFELFTNNLCKDRCFFQKLKELGISYTTLLEILADFIKTEATDEEKVNYLYAKKHSYICKPYSDFYDNYNLLKDVYDRSAKVNFDSNLLVEVANKMGYNYKYYRRLLRGYITLFATEEEYIAFEMKLEDNTRKMRKIEQTRWYIVINSVLSKEFDEAVNYIMNEQTMTYNCFGNYINIYRVHNPFNLTEEELTKTCNYLSRLQKQCLEYISKKTTDEQLLDKEELAKAKLKEFYLQYKEIVQAYVDNKILAGDVSPKDALTYSEFDILIKSVCLFDKDLYDKYTEKRNQEEDLNNNYNVCLKILECLGKGVNVNGQKDSFTIFDFRLLTTIKPNIFYRLIHANLGLTREQIVTLRQFFTKNKELRTITYPEQIISEKISFMHNGETITPTIEERRYVMDYILSKNIPYVSAYKVALRRYIKYGVINEEVIPFEEQVKLTLPTDIS